MTRNFCKQCGTRLKSNAAFCHNCGCRLDPEAPVPGLDGTPSQNAVPDIAAAASATPTAQPEQAAAPAASAVPDIPTAPVWDAAQNAQQSELAFERHKNDAPMNMAQVDPDEIFHSFFGDAFPAPAPDVQTNAPASAAAPAPDVQTNAPASAAAPAPDTRRDTPADITALAPDLLALTVDVMADRPVIEPISVDRMFEPKHTAEAPHSAAPVPPAESAAAPAAAPIPGAANAAPVPPAPQPTAAPIPGMANPAPVPPAPQPAAAPASGAANSAPVPPAPQYAPYMYGQPNAGPAPHYAAPTPHMPSPYPYAPGSWGYGAQQQPEFISTGSYLGMFLLGMIPIVGLIYLIIQAVGNQWRPNRRNFARGFLAAQAIAIGAAYVLLIIVGIFMSATGYYYY